MYHQNSHQDYSHTRRETLYSHYDDFGMKYTKREDAEHLLQTIQDRYLVKADQNLTLYSGVTLEFDYKEPTCKMLMPGYVK